ncbi:hypothetical protein ABID56_001759 [Alkalibacillus flavidus]|uniref:Uncharacterized protein n=1 Tax=Alkalibacillus flavidus TaxID=546021 RepID=A0ABV2KYK7_9BACI
MTKGKYATVSYFIFPNSELEDDWKIKYKVFDFMTMELKEEGISYLNNTSYEFAAYVAKNKAYERARELGFDQVQSILTNTGGTN